MPGPGGGSHGGGGHGGGGFGGGRGGFGGGHGGGFSGGYGGGFHRPHHHHHYHVPFFGYRRHYGYGYGFGSGCLSIFLMPVILLIFCAVMLIAMIGGSLGAVSGGGVVSYDEKTFQDFAYQEYYKAFSETEKYEENILLVFLTTEEGIEYYYIGFVGNDLDDDVKELFGNEYTELGLAMDTSVSQSGYWYSLDSNLSSVVNKMASKIEKIPGFTAPTDSTAEKYPYSKAVNYTDFSVNEKTLNKALEDFSVRTGINIALVVEDAEDVFDTDYGSMWMGIIILSLFAGVAIFLIVKGVNTYRNRDESNQRY